MKVLYVTPYVPSRIRTRPYHLIRALVRQGHGVSLLTAAGTSLKEQEEAEELRGWGVRVEVFPVPLARSLANCVRAVPTSEPLQAVYAHHPEMERRLHQLVREEAFDVVHIEHLRAARLARAIDDVPLVYDSVDCISELFREAAQTAPTWRSRLMAHIDLARTRRYEAWLLGKCDHVVVTSRRDREALEELARRYLSPAVRTAPVTVVTNGVDLEYFRPASSPEQRDGRTVVFTGKMSYHANVAGALFFAREVLPLIWHRDPDVRFQVVGKDPPQVVRGLARDRRVQVTGTVDDLRPYLAKAAVAVCPALYAVGIQNKVLEAMAVGTPVVSTPAGSAALSAEPGKQILVAEGEEELAKAVLQILSDPGLAQSLSVSGREYVEKLHSWEAAARQLSTVYEQACSEI